MEGSRGRPSASGITSGSPPSTYATRLFVVPRSMPTMRDMRLLVLSERLAEVLDDRAQVRTGRERMLEPLQQRTPIAAPVHRGVPRGRAAHDVRGQLLLTREQPVALGPEPGRRLGVEPGGLRRLQCF